MLFLRQLGGSCQTDYKLRFWCTTERRAPLHAKAKALLSTLSKSPSASKACEAACAVGLLLLGLRPAVMGEESELVIYPLCFTHTFNDFAVIMNCLQGREVPPLNQCLIGQAGHLWIKNKEITLYFQEYFFPQLFLSVSPLSLSTLSPLHSVCPLPRVAKSSQTQLTYHSSCLLYTY